MLTCTQLRRQHDRRRFGFVKKPAKTAVSALVSPSVQTPVSAPTSRPVAVVEQRPGAEGRRLLREFIDSHGLGVVDFALTLQRDAQTIHAWLSGKRRPDEGGQKQLLEQCNIPINAWLSPAEIRGNEWKLKAKVAVTAAAVAK